MSVQLNVVDSCGWLEYFANGPNADFFAPVIEAESGSSSPTWWCLRSRAAWRSSAAPKRPAKRWPF